MASFGTEEFIIDASQTAVVESRKGKIERLFGVKIALDVVSEEEEQKQQWLVVSGRKENRSNAKSYVQAMCNPERRTTVRCNGPPLWEDAALEDIERATSVYFHRRDPQTVQVLGTELSCMLAISQLEQTCSVTIITGDGGRPQGRAAQSLSSRSPTEVARAVGDLVMEDSGPIQGRDRVQRVSGSDLLMQAKPVQLLEPHHTPTSSHPRPAVRTMHTSPSVQDPGPGRGGSQHQETSPSSPIKPASRKRERGKDGNTDMVTDKHRSTQVTVAGVKQQKTQLRTLSAGLGYAQADIEESLQFFDFSQHTVEPHEFFCALDEIRANKQKDKEGDGKAPPGKKGTGTNKTGKGRSPGKQTVTSLPSKGKAATVLRTLNPPAGSNSDLDDSIIFIGEELNDSVCVVDPPTPVGAGAAGHTRVTPPDKRSGAAAPVQCGSKRKEFSDDEEQTYLLKPYSSGPSTSSTATHEGWGQDTHATGPATDKQSALTTSSAANESDLRFIVIDGSNVAMSHGNNRVYSCRGIKLCVEHFVKRGHRVKAWVPLTKTYRNQTGRQPPMANQEILEELKEKGYLGYTPARTLNGKHIVSYDDYFILDLAQREDGVVVSNDNFSDCLADYSFIIEHRVLSYVFSDDHFMLPRDPLGRYGPTLDEFLCKRSANSTRHTAQNRKSSKSRRRGKRQRTRPAIGAADSHPFRPTHGENNRGLPNATAVSHRPPNATSVSHRPPNSTSIPYRPPNASIVSHRPPNATSVSHRPPNATSVSHRPSQPSSLDGLQPRGSAQQKGAPRPSHSLTTRNNFASLPHSLTTTTLRSTGQQDSALLLPATARSADRASPPSLTRHPDVTLQLLEALKAVFPETQQEPKIRQVLQNHAEETDLNKLTNYCISALSL